MGVGRSLLVSMLVDTNERMKLSYDYLYSILGFLKKFRLHHVVCMCFL